MKWIKRILLTVVVLVLLFVIAAVALVATFDPNDYKQRIQAAVEKATGRELTLQGDIELSFFPWLGLKLGAARLGNAPGFGEDPFASVNNVQVRVALMPLFRRELQADTVVLQGLEANLSRNAKGVSNWDDLIKDDAKPAPQDQTGQPGKGIAFEIGGVEVEGAAVHWRDAQAGTDVRIAPIDLSTGALAIGEPFDIDLALRVENAEPKVTADIDLSGEANINLDTQRYSLADLQLTIDATGAQLPQGGVKVTLTTNVSADLAAGTATLQPLTVEIAGLRLAGQVAANGLNASPQAHGELASDAFSPRKLLQALGQKLPPTRDPNVLENAKLKLAFSATEDNAKLSQLEFQLDDTRVTGEGAVESFEKPHISFVAVLDAIDLDRYQPPESKAAEPAPGQKPAPPTDDSLGLPTDALRDLNMDGRLTAGRVKASGLTVTDVKATVTARDGVVRITPLSMNLYQGALEGNAALDVRGDTPVFVMHTQLEGVQAGTLLTEFAGDDYLTGTTRLGIDLKTRGDRISTLQQALNGSLNASFSEGSISNSDLAGRIGRVVAFFRGQPDAAAADDKTRFTSLTGSAQIVNGVLNNNNLALVSPLILAKGQGTVNVAQAAMDYTLNIALNDNGQPRGNRFVPIGIGGPLADLNYSLALTDAVKEQAEQAVRQELQEREGEVKEKVQDKLEQELEGIRNKFGF